MINYILEIIKEYFKPSHRQYTFIYCKQCNNELVSSKSFVYDYETGFLNVVKYKCSQCNLESYYNFDIAPVAVNWLDLEAPRLVHYPDGFDYLEREGLVSLKDD